MKTAIQERNYPKRKSTNEKEKKKTTGRDIKQILQKGLVYRKKKTIRYKNCQGRKGEGTIVKKTGGG